ncbi:MULTISPECIES: NAD(P)-dependent oxidoreductase [unclassified Mucilaginibacter]|uniref:NAD(P)-dependent oxidoreductase n=1 Tax=unclassified Mucilaginibacter TaxID=2617802 RepID=UPI000966E878|nr:MULTISPECIES: NAD(P)-dependent oxidoreductase [unclassified Mucilaginibacter]OJW15293.1 MAG: 6-phosphogluconate dehydrogenase [Mucilaginibacter sp. 44-25]PLW88624.1 MAG: NAD(P)-dependent oxidoreductase [Mucilaginibacter sp.]HEK20535.1 NAD(P)-dependent oxidoreductase [Bacteroidota bacterium]
MNTTKIGWIGLGLMGTPMSKQLLKAGYPLTVYNRSKDKEAGLKEQGANTASSPKELLPQSDVVVIMVTDDKAIRDIFDGEDGLLAAEGSEKVIINMSTVSPDISKEMAQRCQQHGLSYLDAPVSGSVKQAETAQLVIMAGGEQSVFEKVKPVLETMGKLAVNVGDTGAGNAAKLAINTLLSFYTQGLAEAVILAKNNGIAPEVLLELLGNAAIANPYTKLKGEAIVNDNFKPAFSLKNILKDLKLSRDIGLTTPLGKTALETFEAAAEQHGDEDLIAIYKYLDSQA